MLKNIAKFLCGSLVVANLNFSATAAPNKQEIKNFISNMSIEEKVGQMFIVRTNTLEDPSLPWSLQPDSNNITEVTDQMVDTIKKYHVGGVCLFSSNIESSKQIQNLINALQKPSGIPLFIAIDEEGGRVARIANTPSYGVSNIGSAESIGSTYNKDYDIQNCAYEAGLYVGKYLSEAGVNINFAPVVDINSNPENLVIKDRAFSNDVKVVMAMAKAMSEGLKEQNIIPTLKHFPGHGDTAADSHIGMATSYKTLSEMEECELLPYKNLDSSVCVMSSHISAPNAAGDDIPASMSPIIIKGWLRKNLGFDGVVITDSTSMGAISNKYSPEEAAINAIKAGNDIVLDPRDFLSSFNAVTKAVKNGEIDENTIDKSVYRILELKYQYGIFDPE